MEILHQTVQRLYSKFFQSHNYKTIVYIDFEMAGPSFNPFHGSIVEVGIVLEKGDTNENYYVSEFQQLVSMPENENTQTG